MTAPNVSTTSNIPTISLEMAERMLTKFDGDRSKLHEFIDNSTMAMSLIKPEFKPILFTLIKSKVTDKARILIKNRNFEDWTTLKQYLTDAYSDRRTQGQWQLELHSCKQNPNEDVISFANKVENCYIKLLSTLDEAASAEHREGYADLLQKQALSVFLAGLNRDISLIVKSRNPISLEDAVQLALNEEREIKSLREISKYQNINNSNARHCFNCNRSGHTTQNCRSRPSHPNFATPSTRNLNPSFRQPQNHSFTRFQTQTPRQPGPYNFNNNQTSNVRQIQSTKICNYCKKPGHLIHECRKRQFNNSKNKNPPTSSGTSFLERTSQPPGNS